MVAGQLQRVRKKYLISGIILVGIGVCICIALFFLPVPEYVISDPSPEMQKESDTITRDTLNRLHLIAADLQYLADDLSGLTPDDPQAPVKLYELYERYPNAAAIVWVDKKTNTTLTAPVFSQADLLLSLPITQINESSFARDKNKRIVIGPLNSEMQGMIVCFAVPVYGTEGGYTGFVFMTHGAAFMQNHIPVPQSSQENVWTDVWIVNSEGILVHHPDAGSIGQNIYQGFFAEEHPDLTDGLFYIIEHPAGAIHYRAYDLSGTQIVNKTGVWQTISFGGQDLRVVTEQYPIPHQVYPYVENATQKDQEEVVHAMARLAKKQGMETAVAEFTNPNGAFAKKGYNLFAYTMDGTAVISAKEALIGANRLNYHDAYGMRPVSTMMLQAEQGGGYVYYYRIVPYTKDQAVLTSSYLQPVNNNWFVGASRAVSAVPQTYNISKREDVTNAVRRIHGWVTTYGKEAALAMIADQADEAFIRNEHILAVSYDGELLADSQRQNKIGEDIFYLTDSHGTSTIREAVMMAKEGGGYLYLENDASVPGENTISLAYVEPMDDNWCVLSMIPLENYPASG